MSYGRFRFLFWRVIAKFSLILEHRDTETQSSLFLCVSVSLCSKNYYRVSVFRNL